jgi:hypothetical protein
MRYPLAIVLAAALSMTACPSQDCVPHSEACIADSPRLCSSTGHGYAASGAPAVPCSAIGGTCVVVAGRATCVRDGGADVPATDTGDDAADGADASE